MFPGGNRRPETAHTRIGANSFAWRDIGESVLDGSGFAVRIRVNASPDLRSFPPLLAVADDDEMHAELVSTWLEHRGFRVLRFGSGDALLEWATSAAEPVEAVVLDVDMPGRDGFQSCRELRSFPSYARIPAVFVSAASADAVPPELRSETGTAFIRKDGEMLERLSSWLDRTLLAAA